MLTRRKRGSTQAQAPACLENASSSSAVPQTIGSDLLATPSAYAGPHSRSHSYGLLERTGYEQTPLDLAYSGHEDRTYVADSLVTASNEQASMSHYQCGSWDQHSFGDHLFADRPSLGFSVYSNQGPFVQDMLYDHDPSQGPDLVSPHANSISTSSIHSSPVSAEITSQPSGSTINLDNLDSLTRAIILNLIRNTGN
jgi:hypothetical protein